MEERIGLEFILKVFNIKKSEIADMLGIPRPNVTAWLKYGTDQKYGRPIPEERLKQLSEHFKLPEYLFQKELTPEEQLKIKLQQHSGIRFEDLSDEMVEIEKADQVVSKAIKILTESSSELSENSYDPEEKEELIEKIEEIAENYYYSIEGLWDAIASKELSVTEKSYVIEIVFQVLDNVLSSGRISEEEYERIMDAINWI